MNKKVIITGVTGLIGSKLAIHLNDCGFEVTGLSRSNVNNSKLSEKGIRIIPWGGGNDGYWIEFINGSYAIINLAGENIGSGKWTKRRRKEILDSRLNSIHYLQDAVKSVEIKPEIFIQASAIGYYGPKTGRSIDEKASPGQGFLAEVCKRVEEEVFLTKVSNVISIRTGVVLSKKGGALAKIIAPISFGAGGYPGSGKQMVSWIHLDDVVHGIRHLLGKNEHPRVYNFTAPGAASMKDLVQNAVSVKRALFSFPVPPFLLKAVFGKGIVNETLLADQWISPNALIGSGYIFKYPDLRSALKNLLV